MNTDRELLELAAKAAGIELWHEDVFTSGLTQKVSKNGILRWNPLEDDGDALRLAVTLSQLDGGLLLALNSRLASTSFAQCTTNERVVSPQDWMGDDPFAATRRVIVRAAAEIGRYRT